jgi:hypothetical protein
LKGGKYTAEFVRELMTDDGLIDTTVIPLCMRPSEFMACVVTLRIVVFGKTPLPFPETIDDAISLDCNLIIPNADNESNLFELFFPNGGKVLIARLDRLTEDIDKIEKYGSHRINITEDTRYFYGLGNIDSVQLFESILKNFKNAGLLAKQRGLVVKLVID